MKKAVIFGSTGLTGSVLLQHLIDTKYYTEIVCFVRREKATAEAGAKYIVTNFSDLDTYGAEFENADVFCCLGTTIKQVNYDKEKIKEADLYNPLLIANCVKKYNANQLLIISALGAKSNSSIFYNRVKGELQDKLLALKLNSLHILQPSLLVGDRIEKRAGEKVGEVILNLMKPFLIGGLKKYRSIKVTTIAKTMLKLAKEQKQGEYIYTSDLIQQIADA